ncbi:methyltransferase family protein [Winogradskyella litoriviva]|uniref:methyltransferase family protein n=1 Tax=Winogradskyella litoriviva TaxID=1220182 RepID=UPI001884D2F8|nr:methyltransferase [Winogradskyella litoriviva]
MKIKKDYIYVGIQLVLFVTYILPVRIIYINLPEWLNYLGLFILSLGLVLGLLALFQLNKKLSPFPTPVLGGKLLTSGAYSISRHPIYTSVLAITFGFALYESSFFKFIIFLLLWLLFYFKSNYEEQLLKEKFLKYSDYKIKTKRFI